jgi:rhamnulose-1-phosphate aldolase/alcohol dehydrogenase
MRGNLWGPDAPSEEQPIDLVVYRSRLIGADPDLVLWGGGNTSVKTREADHLGRLRDVLRIKGSGTDLKSIDRSGFPGIYREDVLPLLEREDMTDEEMVAYLERCMVEPSGRRPSIETLLHAFLPARHIDHTHADAIVTLTNNERGPSVVRQVFGEHVAVVPYRRPGFRLSKEVHSAARGAEAIVLDKHGLVTWGETAEESYRKTIELVERAEAWIGAQGSGIGSRAAGTGDSKVDADPGRVAVDPSRAEMVVPPASELSSILLRLRGRLGHRILRLWSDEPYQTLANRLDVAEIAASGPATPDHILRIRPWACVVEGDPGKAVDDYEDRYCEWFKRHAPPGMEMLSPQPKVFLIPGAGIVTAGANQKDAEVTGEVALHTLQVASRSKDIHGSYLPIGDRDLFDIEYWPLELYKLSLAPPAKELEGRIIIVTGAASGIGRAVARHLAGLGACLVLVDLNEEGLDRTAMQIREGSSTACHSIVADVAHESSVQQVMHETILAVGGVDALVSNAGIAAAGNLMDLDLGLWRRSMDVNATSHFLMTREVMNAMTVQGLAGSLVYIASKNAFSPGAGFGAYSAAKAAEVQLARIAALEGGSLGIRSNVVNPDAVFEDSGLWTEELRRERAAAHGVPLDELEQFYAQRNLLKTTVSGRDVAEAVAFLISDRSRAITGTVLTVDGGLPAAFPR